MSHIPSEFRRITRAYEMGYEKASACSRRPLIFRRTASWCTTSRVLATPWSAATPRIIFFRRRGIQLASRGPPIKQRSRRCGTRGAGSRANPWAKSSRNTVGEDTSGWTRLHRRTYSANGCDQRDPVERGRRQKTDAGAFGRFARSRRQKPHRKGKGEAGGAGAQRVRNRFGNRE